MVPKISVILPTYNERENIRDLVMAIENLIKNPLEIIVVDDNSPDGTWKVVEELSEKDSCVKLIRRMKERGVATAIANGTSASTGGIVIWMDTDFSHPPKLLPKMIKAVDGYDIVIASRFVKGGKMVYTFTRNSSSRLLNLFASLMLDSSIKDYTGGYMAIKRNVLKKIKATPLGSGHGEFAIAFIYRAKKAGFRIKEISFTYMPRKKGQTKTSPSLWKLMKFGYTYLASILRLRLKV